MQQRQTPYGTHHPDGIFVAAGPGLRSGVEIAALSILDVAPTLLYSLGIPIPTKMEGLPALSAFEPAFTATQALRWEEPKYASLPARAPEQPMRLGTEAETVVMNRLKQLGYLE